MDDPESVYQNLLKKYLDGTATEAERAQVERWYAQADLLRTDDEPEDERRRRMERNWQALHDRTLGTRPLPVRRLRTGWYRLAASIALVVALGWAGYQFTHKPNQPSPVSVDKAPATVLLANTTNQPQTHRLADGSDVVLQPGSQIRFARTFMAAERVVQLSGEASFRVKRDTNRRGSARPFLVHGNGVVTRVLGTQFTVRAFPGKPTTEVSVQEGRVAVYRQPEPNAGPSASLILTPNERATYTVASDRLTKSLVEEPMVLATPQSPPPSFIFDDTPLAAVFAELERAYNVDIVFDADLLRNCTLTARLTDQSLFTKLRMICASVGADYSVQNTRLVVSGGGCD